MFEFSGLGQGDNDYLHIQEQVLVDEIIFKAFAHAGFAKKVQDENKLLVLPCPLGTFVDSSVSDPVKLECLNCQAGSNILNHQRYLNTEIKYRLFKRILHTYTHTYIFDKAGLNIATLGLM